MLGFANLLDGLEKAPHNQLSFAVYEGVGHVLLSREPVGSLQRLYPERAMNLNLILEGTFAVVEESYLTRCFTNFSWLFTAGMFL